MRELDSRAIGGNSPGDLCYRRATRRGLRSSQRHCRVQGTMTSPKVTLTTDLYETQHGPGLSGPRRGQGSPCSSSSCAVCRNGAAFFSPPALDDALTYLETLRFSPGEIDWLKSTKRFRSNLIDYLAGTVSPAMSRHPGRHRLLSQRAADPITAPLPMAQIVETRLINILHFQTMIASKAARMVLAAPGKFSPTSDCAPRTAPRPDCSRARASFIAGFGGAANVLAGERYGIPIVGTMAHSFVQVHDDEMTAFENFARSRPEGVILLIDTYDTEAGARKVVELAPKLQADGISDPRRAHRQRRPYERANRRRFAAFSMPAGLKKSYFVSGGINEDVLLKMAAAKAPIDGFGIGVNLDASIDAPSLDCAYKLQDYAGRPRRKLPRASRPGPAASRCGVPTTRRSGCAATCSRLRATGTMAKRLTCGDAWRQTRRAGADARANS